MKYRKLRIAWSATWGIVAVLLIVLWVHTIKNQVKAATWISRSHYIHAIVFLHWMQIDVAQPNWQPPDLMDMNYRQYLHSLFVAKPGPLTSPVHRWHIGASGPPFTPGASIRLPIWCTVLLSASLAILPWVAALTRIRRFSLRTLLIAMTVVAVVLGVIVWALRR